MLRLCKKEITELLETFPTTLEQDVEILKSPSLAMRVKYAIWYRMGRKAALRFTLELILRLSAFVEEQFRYSPLPSSYTQHEYEQASRRILEEYVNEFQQKDGKFKH